MGKRRRNLGRKERRVEERDFASDPNGDDFGFPNAYQKASPVASPEEITSAAAAVSLSPCYRYVSCYNHRPLSPSPLPYYP